MTVSIVSGFENLYLIMKGCVEAEMTSTGLLKDVETFIPVYLEEEHVEEPVVWMYQLETTPSRQADISQTMELTTPFQFNCAIYESDIQDSNTSAQNLACRVVIAILNNWQRVQSELLPGQRMIRNITLDRYYPLGTIEVNGKSERLPVIGVRLNVNHIINWKLCCRIIEDNDNDNEEVNDGE